MKQRHANNISALIHFMDGLNAPDFTMTRYVHWCNTPACALGWACTLPALKAEGLDFKVLTAEGGGAAPMAEAVFGEYFDLFASSLSRSIKTPAEWAQHAREFLREQGHDVTPHTAEQRDDFRRFMERVLAKKPALQGLPVKP